MGLQACQTASSVVLLMALGKSSASGLVSPLQTDVLLQLDLQYTRLSTQQRTCESLRTPLQKPLLGQFFSQQSHALPTTQRTPACASAICPGDAPVLSVDPMGQRPPRTGFGRSLPSSNPSHSCSEPEENDESDLGELCLALLRTGPGQGHP